jgi:photosystem II stability/assembly factor-like uncharacterized protein
MRMNGKRLAALAIAMTAALSASAQTWRQAGPPGGTVISLEGDPHDVKRLYLGTSDGHVFTSNDEGAHWQLLSRIGANQDDVITHILVDPRNSNRLYASTWTLYSGGGGVYRSDDAGRTWKVIGLAHETVRALAQAPTNPKILVAGSLTGVYRSKDEGATWERITPANHEDLRNFDSVAFDPRDENIIYAGTYHLPWKTTNGGKEWFPIQKGMIDDSDVMSIVVDPANPENVHATACSGIYHSVNAAQTWTKYKGIPFVFRRTQLIRQDPQHPETLYAGTTSGLWKTTKEGGEWKRMTPGDWVINAVVIDPQNPQKVILGTEREGVQISENGGATFASANAGFQHQHILDVAMERDHPERALAVLTFDTDAFLATKNGGASWSPLGPGLKRTDLRRVYAAPTGWWASLINGGWMKYDETSNKWVKAGLFLPDPVAAPAAPQASKGKGKAAAAKRPAPKAKTVAPQLAAFLVNDMAFSGDEWFAATNGGVLVSRDKGATWKSASSDALVKQPAQSLEASLDGSQVWAIAQRNLLYSADGGAHWNARELSFAAAGNLRLHRADDANLFITSNMGLYVSRDAGRNWNREEVRELQFQDVAGSGNALVVALQKHGLLASYDGGKSWQHVNDPLAEGYFPVVRARRNGVLVAASATEGLLTLEPGGSSASGGGGSSALLPAAGGMQKPQN